MVDLSSGHDVVLLMVNRFGCFPRKMVYLISTASTRIHGASLDSRTHFENGSPLSSVLSPVDREP